MNEFSCKKKLQLYTNKMYLLIDLNGIRHKGKSHSYKIKIYYLIFKKCENKNKVYISSVTS